MKPPRRTPFATLLGTVVLVLVLAVSASALTALVTGPAPAGAGAGAGTAAGAGAGAGRHWVNTWTGMPQLTEPANLPPAPYTGDKSVLVDTTLRQTVRVTAGGPRIRLRFSNAYGDTPLPLTAVTVADRKSVV